MTDCAFNSSKPTPCGRPPTLSNLPVEDHMSLSFKQVLKVSTKHENMRTYGSHSHSVHHNSQKPFSIRCLSLYSSLCSAFYNPSPFNPFFSLLPFCLFLRVCYISHFLGRNWCNLLSFRCMCFNHNKQRI